MASHANAESTVLQIKSGGAWVNLPAPNEINFNFADLDAADTTRTSTGKMVRQVVRGGANNVRTIELKWQNVSCSVAAQILRLIQPKYFNLRYFDIQQLATRQAEFYVGDRKIQVKRYDDGEPFVKEMSFNMIER